MNRPTVRINRALLAACVTVIAALACDEPGKVTGFGSIAVQIVTAPTVSAASHTGASNANPTAQAPSGSTETLALDGVRVTVVGPTNKTASSTTASGGFFDVT